MFWLFINYYVREPLDTTWTISEYDWIIQVFIEKNSKVLGYSNKVKLIWINREIKISPSSRNSICDNDDLWNIL